jgi:crotonobetainyl-CoA:carnitine CoA-transferase CaiB-like acyl-CoA transferase
MSIAALASHLDASLPLTGVVVLDASRMLPGAVLARQLVDLGARVIRVEDPRGGDPMRLMPPIVGGVGVGYSALLRGSESIALDLREPKGIDTLARLARKVDVFIESFRPGALRKWGFDLDTIEADHPGLVSVSLPGFPASIGGLAHDMNLVASSGLMRLLGEPRAESLPGTQLADVSTGLLAATAICAALLRRARTGHGARVEQPLATGALPLVAWPRADAARGGGGATETALAGHIPCYRLYPAANDTWLAVGTLEPKLWMAFCAALEVPELGARGLDAGPRGHEAIATITAKLAAADAATWVERLRAHDLPLSEVRTVADPDPAWVASELFEDTPLRDGTTLRGVGPAIPSLSHTPTTPVPTIGEHTASVLRELLGE